MSGCRYLSVVCIGNIDQSGYSEANTQDVVEELKSEIIKLSMNGSKGSLGQIITILNYGYEPVQKTLDVIIRITAELPYNIRLDLCTKYANLDVSAVMEILDNFAVEVRPTRDCLVIGPPTGTCLMGCRSSSDSPSHWTNAINPHK